MQSKHCSTWARERSFFLAVLLVFAGVISVAPQYTFASTSVAVRQVLPQNAQTCPALGVGDIHPYIYDGALHSFDISITDPSYVAISGEVDGTLVSLRQISRWRRADGTLRLHIDVPTTPLRRVVPISITLLSARPGGKAITCLAVISTSFPPVPVPAVPIPIGKGETPPQAGRPTPTSAQTTKDASSSTAHVVTATNVLGGTCGTPSGPVRLWTVLLVLYAMFATFLVLQKDKWLRMTREWDAVLIVGVFVALLLFWYLATSCRTSSWAPVVATLIACAGLMALMRGDDEKEKEVLLLKGPRPNTQPRAPEPQKAQSATAQTSVIVPAPAKTQALTPTQTAISASASDKPNLPAPSGLKKEGAL